MTALGIMRYLFSQISKIDQELRGNLLKTVICAIAFALFYLIFKNILLTFLVMPAVVFLIFPWDSRPYIAFGLLFIVFCPILIAFEKQYWAEKMAEYAFFLLSLGVIVMILDFTMDRFRKKKKYQNIHGETNYP